MYTYSVNVGYLDNYCSTVLRDVRRLDKVEEVFLDGETMSAQLLVKIGDGNVRVKVRRLVF